MIYSDYMEIDGNGDDWSWQVAEADVLALADETAALGDAVEVAFKSAASVFYDSPDVARLAADLEVADGPILAKIVAVLQHRTLAGEHYRRIGELQQMVGAFAQMGGHCREIAKAALDLQGAAQTVIARSAPDVSELLRTLIHQTFVVVRGSVVAIRSAHAPTAHHVRGAVAELDHTLLDLRTAAQRAIALHANHTVLFQQVMLAGGRMREIGMQAQAIARLIAQAPADAIPDPADAAYN